MHRHIPWPGKAIDPGQLAKTLQALDGYVIQKLDEFHHQDAGEPAPDDLAALTAVHSGTASGEKADEALSP